MNKEELIKLLDSLTIEEVKGISLNYYSEEEPSNYSNKYRELRTLSFGDDINKKIDNIRQEQERTFEYMKKDFYEMSQNIIDKQK